MTEPLRIEQHPDDVVELILDRPERLNALSRATVEGLHEALEGAAREGARAVVLRGAGRAFCGGFDLRQEGTERQHNEQIARMQQLTTVLRDAPFPSVCALHGHAVGGGLELALACDVIVAASDASLMFPDVRAGFAVGGGATYLLPLMMGLPRTRLLLLLGEPISGRLAYEAGMVAVVAENADAAHAEALATAGRLAAIPHGALLTVRHAIERGLNSSLTAALDAELADNITMFSSERGLQSRDSFASTGRY